jgi:membrane protein DedA with SNARE-associated domain
VRHGVRVVAVSYFLPIPNPMLYLSCGIAGMPLLVFVLGDVIGTLLWTGLLVGLGWGLGKSAVDVVDQLDRYELGLTAVVVAVLIVLSLVRKRRGSQQGHGRDQQQRDEHQTGEAEPQPAHVDPAGPAALGPQQRRE